jgi:hypothetical protein
MRSRRRKPLGLKDVFNFRVSPFFGPHGKEWIIPRSVSTTVQANRLYGTGET